MNKKVKEEYIKSLKNALENAKKGFASAKLDTIEAEGRMVTRYDSTKTEVAWLADGFQKEIIEIENCINKFNNNYMYSDINDIVLLEYINKDYSKSMEKILLDRDTIKEDLLISILGQSENELFLADTGDIKSECVIKEIIKSDSSDKNTIHLNSVVKVCDDDGFEDIYFIVSDRGGIDIEIDGEEVFCISKNTPIAKKLLGKKIGDEVKVKIVDEINLKIIDII